MFRLRFNIYLIIILSIFVLVLNAQSKKDPTPITTVGDFHRSDKISLNPIYENGVWDNLQSKQQKTSHLEKVIQEELQVRQTQNYNGYERVQSFINLNGISNISNYLEELKSKTGFVHDSTYNGRYNIPARTAFGKIGGQGTKLVGTLVGDDPLDLNDYYFWNPTTGEKVGLEDLDKNSSVYVGSIAQTSEDNFLEIPDIIQFNMKDGSQESISSLRGYVLRNSPNNSFISLISPGDTTIDRTAYEKNPDLLSDDYGTPSVSSSPQEGDDFYFEDAGENFIEGKIENEITKTAVDTTYLTPDKKVFKVRIKAKGNQLEKNLIGNKRFPGNTFTFVHNLSSDSTYYNITVDLTTDIGNDETLPTEFNLYQNYPNPFNGETTIKYAIPTSPFNPSPYKGEGNRERLVSLIVYDALGRKVKTLINESLAPGEYELKFDASDLPSGVYFYKLTSGNHSQTRKMILLR